MRLLVVLNVSAAALASASGAPHARSPDAARPEPISRGGGLPVPVPCPGCWVPAIETSWQWQLQGPVDTSLDVDMYDVDGFEVPKGVVAGLHADGSMVVCYLSAGPWERWRPDGVPA